MTVNPKGSAPKKSAGSPKKKYRVIVGINYPNPDPKVEEEKRAEPGDVVDDIPSRAVSYLMEMGVIEEAE